MPIMGFKVDVLAVGQVATCYFVVRTGTGIHACALFMNPGQESAACFQSPPPTCATEI